MYCIKCGNELPEIAVFCDKCGTKRYSEDSNNHNIEKSTNETGGSTAPSTHNQIQFDNNGTVMFGIGAKIYFWFSLVAGGLSTLNLLMWLSGSRPTYGSFWWGMSEAFRYLNRDYLIFSCISGIIGCIAWGCLLLYRTRMPVYVTVGMSILSFIVALSNGYGSTYLVLSTIVGFIILYFILRKYWIHMK